jgi:Skp family chaperone for outer membrane proteins
LRANQHPFVVSSSVDLPFENCREVARKLRDIDNRGDEELQRIQLKLEKDLNRIWNNQADKRSAEERKNEIEMYNNEIAKLQLIGQ